MDSETGAKELQRRQWVFLQEPQDFEITCDLCGGTNITWSEYERKIWCYDCNEDVRGTGGIFDGPIPVKTCEILGIRFDKINIQTREVARFDPDRNCYVSTMNPNRIIPGL